MFICHWQIHSSLTEILTTHTHKHHCTSFFVIEIQLGYHFDIACLLLQTFRKLKVRKYALNVNGHCETCNIVLVLRILTTCMSQCSLHPIKAVILLWYNVFGHYKCIIFYQVLSICVTFPKMVLQHRNM
jgi:hypothetical protein